MITSSMLSSSSPSSPHQPVVEAAIDAARRCRILFPSPPSNRSLLTRPESVALCRRKLHPFSPPLDLSPLPAILSLYRRGSPSSIAPPSLTLPATVSGSPFAFSLGSFPPSRSLLSLSISSPPPYDSSLFPSPIHLSSSSECRRFLPLLLPLSITISLSPSRPLSLVAPAVAEAAADAFLLNLPLDPSFLSLDALFLSLSLLASSLSLCFPLCSFTDQRLGILTKK